MKPSKPIKTKKKKSGNAYNRPYNRYNLYFILERENLILAKGGTPKTSTLLPGDPGFDGLDLPPLPPRFDHLKMPDGWCIPGHQKKRPHRKTHGVATFRELAQCIAKSWKTIDGATLAYCAAVEKASVFYCCYFGSSLFFRVIVVRTSHSHASRDSISCADK